MLIPSTQAIKHWRLQDCFPENNPYLQTYNVNRPSEGVGLIDPGAKTRSRQEHVLKGLGKGWSLSTYTRAGGSREEASGLLANVSCRRTPGPIALTTEGAQRNSLRSRTLLRRAYCTGYVSWGALKHRAHPRKQKETLTAISRTNSRNMHTLVFNRKVKLFEERRCSVWHPGEIVTPIYRKPVNSVITWIRWATTDITEGRGPVVANNKTAKGAKSSHIIAMGDAHLGSNQKQERSPNGERNRYESETSSGKALKAIERIKQKGTKHPWNNLIRLLRDEDLWVAAYTKLAPNPGSNTRGGAGGTIDGTSLKTLRALQLAVLEGNFKWGTTRRTYIPKPSGGQRPLGIPEFQDRIVQEIIRRILEAIYEPQFVDQSHGFRPQRSQHSCIKYIRAWFPGTVWYIEGDISKCFDTIDHDKLKKILRKDIADTRFITLISKGLKSKVLNPSGKLTTTELGVPQGGIASPILSNIYLHQLDKFLLRLQTIVNKGKRRRQAKEYHRLTSQLSREKALLKNDPQKIRALLKRRAQLKSKDPQDPNYRRLQFVRYADDFLVGIIGPKLLAIRIKNLIARFLKHKLKLELSLEKTVINHCSKRIPFLGFQICTSSQTMVSKARLKTHTIRQRIPATNVRIYADTDKVIKRLAQKGFCKPGGEPKPNWNLALHAPQSFSVDRAASIIVGLDNYYKVADDRAYFTHRIMWVIRSSLAKTFAAKFKLQTQAQVFAVAGADLSKPIASRKNAIGMTDEKAQAYAKQAGGDLIVKMPKIPFTRGEHIPRPDKSHSYSGQITNESIQKDPLATLNFSVLRARSALQGVCSKCGTSENIEMHHVRALKHLKGKSIISRLMISANRKQIPLCRPCHLKEHGYAQKKNPKSIPIADDTSA